MNTTVIVLIIVVVLLLVGLGVVGAMLARRRRSEHLQEHYGPEYERTLAETGDRRAAEQQLTEREQRHRDLDIRDLDPQERERYAAEWTDVQRGFVDDPVQSVNRADALVTDIMRTRGYPVEDFDRRAEDVSVEHPLVVDRYREARDIHLATRDGHADTEQQRHAVTSYRALIDALLGGDVDHGRHHVDDSRDADTRNADSRNAADTRNAAERTDDHVRPTEERTR